ncbi:MAG: hypothetical protein R3E31_01705 [Chloroflexota bacterium]|nr:hypothetical protein [Anaerolineales bacterium]
MKRWFFFMVTAVFLLLVLAACSGPTLTYTVAGTAAEARIAYRDDNGDMVFDTVSLPWEKRISISDPFSYEVNVERNDAQGNVSCAIALNGQEVGRVDGATFAECRGKYQAGQVSLNGRFDQQE